VIVGGGNPWSAASLARPMVSADDALVRPRAVFRPTVSESKSLRSPIHSATKRKGPITASSLAHHRPRKRGSAPGAGPVTHTKCSSTMRQSPHIQRLISFLIIPAKRKKSNCIRFQKPLRSFLEFSDNTHKDSVDSLLFPEILGNYLDYFGLLSPQKPSFRFFAGFWIRAGSIGNKVRYSQSSSMSRRLVKFIQTLAQR
jgi:hypothetical protein